MFSFLRKKITTGFSETGICRKSPQYLWFRPLEDFYKPQMRYTVPKLKTGGLVFRNNNDSHMMFWEVFFGRVHDSFECTEIGINFRENRTADTNQVSVLTKVPNKVFNIVLPQFPLNFTIVYMYSMFETLGVLSLLWQGCTWGL